jgi:uncharacterized protein YcbK (DUF882 family)
MFAARGCRDVQTRWWVNARVPVRGGKAQPNVCRILSAHAASCGVAALIVLFGVRGLQNAVAEGDTRTISLHHIHTDEDVTVTFKRDGRYDEAALEKLNWFLRDWRKQQETRMDPHLIDLVWEVQREAGSNQPIWVVCGYRSPETNAMLRRRSSGVARFSQHMLGHAMDFYIPGVALDQLRVIGLRLQRGGVGFYPTSGSPFVHMDTGGIRMWPRMTREQLVRVFPDQRAVYLPTDGRPLAGYDLALADIKKRGGTVDTANVAEAEGESGGFNPIAKLLNLARGGEQDQDGRATAPTTTAAAEPLRSRAKAAVVAAVDRAEDKLKAEKTKIAEVAARTEQKLAVEKTKIAQAAAKIHLISRAEAAPSAATPNQIVATRGFWQGVPDRISTARPADGADVAIAAVALPSDHTGSVVSLAAARGDQNATPATLAYAEPVDQAEAAIMSASDRATAALRNALLRAAAAKTGNSETTVVIKRVNGAQSSTVLSVSTRTVATVPTDPARMNDPWLRAIAMSPSVRRFLCITALGVRDFQSLAQLMVKPASSVMMAFSGDPNPGLTFDHFSGSPVGYMSTVALHTTELR